MITVDPERMMNIYTKKELIAIHPVGVVTFARPGDIHLKKMVDYMVNSLNFAAL